MVRDVMTIRLYLSRIRVVKVVEDTISQLVVEVASNWSVSRCPWRSFKTRMQPLPLVLLSTETPAW